MKWIMLNVRPKHQLLQQVLLFGVCSLLSAGCGGSSNPVSGKVFFKGEPCKGAMVIFHPVGNSSPVAVRPSGVVEADGSFKLTSDPKRPGDGATPGDYIVAITWLGPPPGVPQKLSLGGESKGGEVDRLGGKYKDQHVSKLKVTIKPGSNQLEPFNLD